MTATDSRIERFLNTIKTEERSSPTGMYWQEFYEFLQSNSPSGTNKPPVPLILAASGESDTAKHARLCSQLQWALENQCLEEAIHYLERLSGDKWNSGPLERWDQNSY